MPPSHLFPYSSTPHMLLPPPKHRDMKGMMIIKGEIEYQRRIRVWMLDFSPGKSTYL